MDVATDSREANKNIVKDFLSVFSRGDVPGIAARLHPESTWWVSGRIEGLSGTYTREQMVKLLEGVTQVYKQGALRITPSRMTAEGNFVAVEAESYAELKNGRVYNNLYHFLFEVEDGKILRVKEYMDTKHAHETFMVP